MLYHTQMCVFVYLCMYVYVCMFVCVLRLLVYPLIINILLYNTDDFIFCFHFLHAFPALVLPSLFLFFVFCQTYYLYMYIFYIYSLCSINIDCSCTVFNNLCLRFAFLADFCFRTCTHTTLLVICFVLSCYICFHFILTICLLLLQFLFFFLFMFLC